MAQVAFRAMGCQMLAVLDGATAGSRLAEVPVWFAAWERRLTRFRADSELCRLNRAGQRGMPVSNVLWHVLQVALHAARASGGLVDPTLLGALAMAGYDRTFEALADPNAPVSPANAFPSPVRSGPDRPSPPAHPPLGGFMGGQLRQDQERVLSSFSLPQGEGQGEGGCRQRTDTLSAGNALTPTLSQGEREPRCYLSRSCSPMKRGGRAEPGAASGARACPPDREATPAPTAGPGWRAVDCDRATRIVRLRHGVQIDLGGIAKGWAADTAVKRLGADGPALVDAGGDIAISGPPVGETGWPIGVADPFEPNREIALLVVPRGGVATSGRDYRRWRRGGIDYHHILDPRTARPAVTDVLSATIAAPTAQEADVAAKVALILGTQEGAAWIEAHPRLAGLLVADDGRIVRTRRLGELLWR